MADNTTLNPGSGGDVIASDDIGGVKFQRVKIVLGADNTNDGDVASGNPLPARAEGTGTHGATAGTRPVLAGGEARTTTPTAVTDGQMVRTQHDKGGRVVTTAGAPRELSTRANVTLTATTAETTVLAAGGAGVFNDLKLIVVSNSGTAATLITFRDSTGGAAVLPVQVAANGGGAVIPFDQPLAQTTANNNWTVQCGTSTSSVHVFVQAVRRA